MIKRKFSYYFSVGTNAFAWQTVILSILNIIFGKGVDFNSYVVLQCLCVGFAIAFIMFFTDKLTMNTNFPIKILVDLIDVSIVVLLLGGIVFKWFDFVFTDLLIVAGVILVVYFIVFAIMILRSKIVSEKINQKIREMNNDENSN